MKKAELVNLTKQIAKSVTYSASCRGLQGYDLAIPFINYVFERENIDKTQWELTEIPFSDETNVIFCLWKNQDCIEIGIKDGEINFGVDCINGEYNILQTENLQKAIDFYISKNDVIQNRKIDFEYLQKVLDNSDFGIMERDIIINSVAEMLNKKEF